ncbi:MAG: hypothetical protein U5R49_23440 [Deltaproteobacteria bacterium]|nr:hypothetical protein [Deltaproteobacteria bacterium]
MTVEERPTCRHCDEEMKRWQPPADSTWSTSFLWVCFNDDCPYYVRGWDHMMKTQEVKASYRQSVNPETGTESPLPTWSNEAHRDRIIEE